MSQCDYSRERLDSFITEKDIKQIADWGFDHVRLPITSGQTGCTVLKRYKEIKKER